MEEAAIEIGILLFRKMKIEQKLKKALNRLIRKCFSCLGLKDIDRELKEINNRLLEIKVNDNRTINFKRNSTRRVSII